MTAQAWERPGRDVKLEDGVPKTATLLMAVRDATTDAIALAIVQAEAPADLQGLPQRKISLQERGGGFWYAQVEYSAMDKGADPVTLGGDGARLAFDISATTEHISNSIDVLDVKAAAGVTAADNHGAIGVVRNAGHVDVQGCDIYVPQGEVSYSYLATDDFVTDVYLRTAWSLVGKANNATWKNLDAGEALFLGLAGSKNTTGLWALTYKIGVRANKTGITIGEIPAIDKEGWDYLEIEYAEKEDTTSKTIVKRPIVARVHQVYFTADFSALGIGY